jgi:hypothetical protein
MSPDSLRPVNPDDAASQPAAPPCLLDQMRHAIRVRHY